jgi:hypothetical protein
MRILIFGITLGLVGCADNPAAPAATLYPPQAQLVSPATVTSRIPIDRLVYNPCASEWIQFDGVLNLVGHTTRIADGWYQMVVHWQYARMKGTGLSTGDEYHMSGGYHEIINDLRVSYEDHLVQQWGLVRRSDGASYTLKNVWQVTVNANGNLTIQMDKWSIGCPGD